MAKEQQGLWAALRAIFNRRTARLVLSIPPTAYQAIIGLKLQPDDGPVQVVKDALETHNQVLAAMKKGEVCVRSGTVIKPLALDHITTPEKRRASWNIIPGGKE